MQAEASAATGSTVQRFKLETAVNAKTRGRKGAERRELVWDARLSRVHGCGGCGRETNPAGSLCGSAALRLGVKCQRLSCRVVRLNLVRWAASGVPWVISCDQNQGFPYLFDRGHSLSSPP